MKLPGAQIGMKRGTSAFTLAETMITCGTLVIVLGSIIVCNLYGLSMADRQSVWLGATADANQVLNSLMLNIHSATSMQVGNYSGTNGFTPAGPGNPQSGDALLIYLSTNYPPGPPCVLYYYNMTSSNLVQSNSYATGNSNNSVLVSANCLTNDPMHPIFTEVDYTGAPLYNVTSLASVSVYLYFTTLQSGNTNVQIGGGALVQSYQLTNIISPRVLE